MNLKGNLKLEDLSMNFQIFKLLRYLFHLRSGSNMNLFTIKKHKNFYKVLDQHNLLLHKAEKVGDFLIPWKQLSQLELTFQKLLVTKMS